MSKKLVFRAAADAEFSESAAWYENQRAELGLDFIDHVQEVFDEIAAQPTRYPVVFKDVREAIVSDFPFAIYYRIKSDRIVIIAVYHSSRDPSIWQSRK